MSNSAAGCGLLHAWQSYQCELLGLLKLLKTAVTEMQLHRGETSVQGWIKHIQTLEGVLTLPCFSLYRIFISSSEQNKQPRTQKGKPMHDVSSECLLLPLPFCYGADWELPGTKICFLPILTCISVSFLTQSWCIGTLLIQLFLGNFGAPSV